MEDRPQLLEVREPQFNPISAAANTNTGSSNPFYQAFSPAAATSSDPTTTSTVDDATTISTSLALGISTTATLNQVLPTSSGTAASDAASTDSATTSTPLLADTTASSVVESTASQALTTPLPNTLSTHQTTFETSPSPTPGSPASSNQGTIYGNNPPASSTTPGPAASEGSTLLPLANHAHNPHGMSQGALTAAIAVPILFALLAALLAFLCLRRRNNNTNNNPSRSRRRRGSASAFLFPSSMREKLSSSGIRTTSTPLSPSTNNHTNPTAHATPALAPILTSSRNNAYFTGLDTSSHGDGSPPRVHSSEEYYAPARRSDGGTTFVDPPPPYKATKSLTPQSSQRTTTHENERVDPTARATASRILAAMHAGPPPGFVSRRGAGGPPPPAAAGARSGSPFLDPNTALGGLVFPPVPVQRSQSSRSLGVRSFNSEDYSDTASVHSARAARMSVGSAHMLTHGGVGGLRGGGGPAAAGVEGEEGDGVGEGEGRRGSDPFGDPQSPVSSMGAGEGEEEFHSLTRSGSGEGVSVTR